MLFRSTKTLLNIRIYYHSFRKKSVDVLIFLSWIYKWDKKIIIKRHFRSLVMPISKAWKRVARPNCERRVNELSDNYQLPTDKYRERILLRIRAGSTSDRRHLGFSLWQTIPSINRPLHTACKGYTVHLSSFIPALLAFFLSAAF